MKKLLNVEGATADNNIAYTRYICYNATLIVINLGNT